MVTFARTYRWLLLASGSLSLCGCFSGTIAAQIASSVATHIADKAIATSLEAQRRAEEAKGITLQNSAPDEYWAAFLTSGFTTIEPTIEPINGSASTPQDYRQATYTPPSQSANVHASRLLKIEIWNVVIGEEKTRILENAQRVGAPLPDKLDWPNWQLATGPIDETGKKSIYFLVSPDVGKVKSGSQVVVEISEVGGLHMARYLIEPPTTQAANEIKDRSSQTASRSERFQLSYSH
jgi:hypothetical protein